MENKEKKETMNRKKMISWVLIGILITVVTLVVLFSFNDVNEIWELVRTVDSIQLSWAILCLVVYLLLWPIPLCILSHSTTKAHFLDNYLIGSSEHFFNGITPFSSGGQPVQIYLYTKRDVPAGKSTGIILTTFISFMIATNVFAIASLVYYGRFSVNFNGSTSWMIILGFVMNLFVLSFMIMMAYCRFVRNWLRKLLELLCKIKWIGKYLTKLIPVFDKYCENAQSAAKEIFSHKWSFVLAVLVKGISLVFYYAIPFFILRSLGLHLPASELPFIILASAFAITTMVWVPTPGGTGGIEFAFTTIFTTFAGVTSSIGLAGMILWRGLTYYLLLILSFIEYIVFLILGKKKKPLPEGEEQ